MLNFVGNCWTDVQFGVMRVPLASYPDQRWWCQHAGLNHALRHSVPLSCFLPVSGMLVSWALAVLVGVLLIVLTSTLTPSINDVSMLDVGPIGRWAEPPHLSSLHWQNSSLLGYTLSDRRKATPEGKGTFCISMNFMKAFPSPLDNWVSREKSRRMSHSPKEKSFV